jgi:hypothetical protein
VFDPRQPWCRITDREVPSVEEAFERAGLAPPDMFGRAYHDAKALIPLLVANMKRDV